MLRYSLLLFLFVTDFSYGLEFWDSNAYFEKYPRQTTLIKSFGAVVNRIAEPIQVRQAKTINISAVLPIAMDEVKRTYFLHHFKRRMQNLQIDYRLDVFEYSKDVKDDVLFRQYKKIMRSPPDYLITTLERYQQKSIVESILRRHETHVILYDVSSPVVGWEHESSVFYTGVNYASTFYALYGMVDEAIELDMEIIPIAFSKGYRNYQFCNSLLDVFSGSRAHIKQVLYIDDSLLSKKRMLQRLSNISKGTFIFQCDNFLDSTHRDWIKERSQHELIMNYWLSDDEVLDSSNIQSIGFRIPFKEIEISIAEMIRHHLERKKFPNVYRVDVIVERS